MKTKQIAILVVLSTMALLATATQSHAFFDNVFGDDDKPKHKSSAKSELPIRDGMTMDQVREKLGDPDSENEGSDGRVEWIYYADSVGARFQDGVVNSGCSEVSSYIPFIGSAVNSSSRKATQPIHAKRTGYIIRFSSGKMTSYTKMKSQG